MGAFAARSTKFLKNSAETHSKVIFNHTAFCMICRQSTISANIFFQGSRVSNESRVHSRQVRAAGFFAETEQRRWAVEFGWFESTAVLLRSHVPHWNNAQVSDNCHPSWALTLFDHCRLLSQGADPNYADPDRGTTPLHVAAKESQTLQVRWMVAMATAHDIVWRCCFRLSFYTYTALIPIVQILLASRHQRLHDWKACWNWLIVWKSWNLRYEYIFEQLWSQHICLCTVVCRWLIGWQCFSAIASQTTAKGVIF